MLDIPLAENLDPALLTNNAKLYFLFVTDVPNADSKYICNVQAISGTNKNPVENDAIVNIKLNGRGYTNSALLSGTYTATVPSIETTGIDNAKLIIVLYENGEMMDCKITDITADSRSGEFTVDSVKSGMVLRFMLWNNMNDIKPLGKEINLVN